MLHYLLLSRMDNWRDKKYEFIGKRLRYHIWRGKHWYTGEEYFWVHGTNLFTPYSGHIGHADSFREALDMLICYMKRKQILFDFFGTEALLPFSLQEIMDE